MIDDLNRALREESFTLAYQPLFDASDLRLTGYEALLRWEHPTRGFVSPAEFIPVAEDIGLIAPLGAWVLRQACRDAAAWPGQLSVAVNLSAAQFDNGRVTRDVHDALERSGLGGERLELEITESLLMSDVQRVTATLHELRLSGARIAMDDFGTGYSSLAYLWKFPFDKLKIDRAFTESLVDDPKAALIVNSVVSLAHALGIRVNAEGVETEHQRQALQDCGCNELQGFLLGRPTPNALLTHEDYNPALDRATGTDAPVQTAEPVGSPSLLAE
jgi:EAL domain-containing protein (putative c-di-GMP-specific phosphodiesterase class I)